MPDSTYQPAGQELELIRALQNAKTDTERANIHAALNRYYAQREPARPDVDTSYYQPKLELGRVTVREANGDTHFADRPYNPSDPLYENLRGRQARSQLQTDYNVARATQEPDYSPLMGTLNDLIARGKMLPEAAALVTRKLWAPVVNHPVTQARMAAMNQAALRAIQPASQPQAMQQPAPMPAGPNLYNGVDLYR